MDEGGEDPSIPKFYSKIKTCIFCGGKPLNREHIFPKWYSSLLTIPEGKKLYVDNQIIQGGTLTKQKRRFPNDIDPQIKHVCTTCNGGWMSNLETAARPIITAILDGSMPAITPSSQEILALWATKTAITGSYSGSDPGVPLR